MTIVNHAHCWFVTGGVICCLWVGTVQAAAGSESPLRSMKYTSRPQADAVVWQQDVRANNLGLSSSCTTWSPSAFPSPSIQR